MEFLEIINELELEVFYYNIPKDEGEDLGYLKCVSKCMFNTFAVLQNIKEPSQNFFFSGGLDRDNQGKEFNLIKVEDYEDYISKEPSLQVGNYYTNTGLPTIYECLGLTHEGLFILQEIRGGSIYFFKEGENSKNTLCSKDWFLEEVDIERLRTTITLGEVYYNKEDSNFYKCVDNTDDHYILERQPILGEVREDSKTFVLLKSKPFRDLEHGRPFSLEKSYNNP